MREVQACVVGFSGALIGPRRALCVMKHAGNAQHALVSPRSSMVLWTSEPRANNRISGPTLGREAVCVAERFMTWIRG